MLFRDGKFEIYQIQHDYYEDGRWAGSNLDHFGHPKGFSASGDCWQQTGEIGTFSSVEALEGLAWIRKKHPDTLFRLVLITIEQSTMVI